MSSVQQPRCPPRDPLRQGSERPTVGTPVNGRPRRLALRWRNRVGLALLIGCAGFSAIGGKPGSYPIAAVPFTRVRLTDTFWAPRLEINRTVTIPFGFAKSEQEGRIRNFERAAHKRAGAYEGKMPFDDTDVYKLIEGASYSLQSHPDPALDRFMDGVIAKIAAAQEPDGYITTYKTIDPTQEPGDVGQGRAALDAGALRQPRALQRGTPARGGLRSLSRDRQAQPARRRAEVRRSARSHVRAGQADDAARASDRRDRAHQAGERDRRPALRDAGALLSRSARQCRRPQAERADQPGPPAGHAADRSRRPRGARRVHVRGHGRHRDLGKRYPLSRGGRDDLGRRGVAQAVPDRSDRRAPRRRGVRRGVRAAQQVRLRRDLRVDRQRLLEPPTVSAVGRGQVHRRPRAHALQRR